VGRKNFLRVGPVSRTPIGTKKLHPPLPLVSRPAAEPEWQWLTEKIHSIPQKKSKIKPQTSKTMADVQALTKVLAEHFASVNQTLNEARMSVVVFLFLISLIKSFFT
jgi:uncharacterized protein YllA (UPF0747 family)